MRNYRKFIVVAALVAPTAAMANASGPHQIQSNTVPGTTESGWVGSMQSNGTITTQFGAKYNDPLFGAPLTCNGVHQEKKNGAVQESFTCSLDKGGVWSGVQPYAGYTAPYGWYSDYAAVKDGTAAFGQMTVQSVTKDSLGNVTSYTGLATYPAGTTF